MDCRRSFCLLLGLTLVCIVIGTRVERDPMRGVARSAFGQEAVPQMEPTETAEPEAEPSEQTALQKFMRRKLRMASTVLEGLVVEDYELLRRGSRQLQRVSEAEEWRVSNDAMYRQYSNEFARRIRQLDDAAEEKAIDDATLAYVQATLSCIECHKWVRAVVVADRQHDDGSLGLPALVDETIPVAFPEFDAGTRARRLPLPVADRQQPARQTSQKAVSAFMRKKLEAAKSVLEGLVSERYDLIRDGADAMKTMNRAAAWQVFKSPEYLVYSEQFRSVSSELSENAQRHNLAAAALTYTRLTVNCVQCHQHVRKLEVATGPGPLKPTSKSAAVSESGSAVRPPAHAAHAATQNSR